jgi:xylulokinase
MPEPFVVGVDIGSGSARAVAVTRSGAVLADSEAAYADDGLPAGEAVPATWLKGAVAAIGALRSAPEAIGFGGQGPTTVAASGERAVTFRHASVPPGSPPEQHASQIAWLRDRFGSAVEPRQLWDWVATALGAPDGAQSLWYDGTPLEGFGDPVPAGSTLGVTDGSYGLPEGIPLAAGANDAYLTMWGSGIDRPGKAFDPGGSTGGLGVAVSAGEHPEAATYGMATHVPGVTIVGGPTAAHGSMLDWWSEITGRSVADLVALAADAPAGSNGVIVLPFFEGERAPRWNPELRAEILGLHLDHGLGVVTRAFLEAAAYGLGHIARDLAAKGIAMDWLVCSGGPSRSRTWNGIKAAVLNVPVEVPSFPQMAAYGAALAGGAAVGWWPRPGEGGAGDWPMPESEVVDPEPLDVYREGLDRFIALGDEAAARLDDLRNV